MKNFTTKSIELPVCIGKLLWIIVRGNDWTLEVRSETVAGYQIEVTPNHTFLFPRYYFSNTLGNLTLLGVDSKYYVTEEEAVTALGEAQNENISI